MFIHVFPDDIDHYLGGEIGRHPELLLDTKTLAVAMGLHIDPLQLYPDLSFKDAEVRRRVWWVPTDYAEN
jgi:hypothetical protein